MKAEKRAQRKAAKHATAEAAMQQADGAPESQSSEALQVDTLSEAE